MKESTLDPDFKNERHLFKITEDTIFDGLKIKIMDDDVGRDDVVGSVCINLFDYAAVSTDGVEIPRERLYPLRKGGELVAVVEFLPSCNLQVTCFEGKELRNPNLVGKTFDPYLYFESDSLCGGNNKLVLKSKTHSNGSKTPQWKEEKLYGLLSDHHSITVTAYDDDAGRDDVIGKCEVNLSDVYKDGSLTKWYDLKTKRGKYAGEVKIGFEVRPGRGVSSEGQRLRGYPVAREGKPDDGGITAYTIHGYGVRGKVFDLPYRIPKARRKKKEEGDDNANAKEKKKK